LRVRSIEISRAIGGSVRVHRVGGCWTYETPSDLSFPAFWKTSHRRKGFGVESL
jgi:hypothetical protein